MAYLNPDIPQKIMLVEIDAARPGDEPGSTER
jgi:hypothetical protein